MDQSTTEQDFARFDVRAIAAGLPATADTLLVAVPSGRWLECEGGVISGLFNEP